MTANGTTNITIDDQDFSRVQYTGTWTRGGSSSDHGGTVSSSTVIGDFFNVSFNGTAISVFGALDSTSAETVISYAVDGAAPSQGTSPSVPGNVFNQQFWQSPTSLTAGKEHILVVTIVGLNRKSEPGEDKNTVWFDYFQVAGSAATSLQTTPVVKSHKNTGAIVGGALGGTVLILASLLLVLLLLRRRRARKEHNESKVEIDHASLHDSSLDTGRYSANDVFARGVPNLSEMRDYRSDMNNTGTTSPRNVSPSSTQVKNDARFSIANPGNPPDTLEGTSLFEREAPLRATQSGKKDGETKLIYTGKAIQHVDSGTRLVNTDAIRKPLELPPVYSAL